jgi:hypothetical protein
MEVATMLLTIALICFMAQVLVWMLMPASQRPATMPALRESVPREALAVEKAA